MTLRRLLAAASLALLAMGTAAAQEPNGYFRDLQRSDSPNDWLIAPAGFPGEPDAEAPVYDVSAGRLGELFEAVAKAEGAEAVTARGEDLLCVVAVTSLLGFEDDVCAQFIALEEGRSTLALYSASREGYWDLGANRVRLEDWLSQIAALAR